MEEADEREKALKKTLSRRHRVPRARWHWAVHSVISGRLCPLTVPDLRRFGLRIFMRCVNRLKIRRRETEVDAEIQRLGNWCQTCTWPELATKVDRADALGTGETLVLRRQFTTTAMRGPLESRKAIAKEVKALETFDTLVNGYAAQTRRLFCYVCGTLPSAPLVTDRTSARCQPLLCSWVVLIFGYAFLHVGIGVGPTGVGRGSRASLASYAGHRGQTEVERVCSAVLVPRYTHRIVLPDLHYNMRTLDAEMTKAEARLSSLQSYISVLKEAQPREDEQNVNAGTCTCCLPHIAAASTASQTNMALF